MRAVISVQCVGPLEWSYTLNYTLKIIFGINNIAETNEIAISRPNVKNFSEMKENPTLFYIIIV